MQLEEFGNLLRTQREKKNISLDTVIQATCINRNVLIALEEGDDDQLPPPVYAKGFARTYGKFLKLENLEDYLTQIEYWYTPEREQCCSFREYAEQSTPSFFETITKKHLILSAITISILLFVVLIFSLSSPDDESYLKEEDIIELTPVDDINTMETINTIDEVSENDAEDPEMQAEALELASPKIEAEKSPEAEKTQKRFPSKASQIIKTMKKRNGTTDITLMSKNDEEVWFEYQQKDGNIKWFLLTPEKSFSLNFKDDLWLRLGNAGGVKILMNDEELPLNFKIGSVKTLKFSS